MIDLDNRPTLVGIQLEDVVTEAEEITTTTQTKHQLRGDLGRMISGLVVDSRRARANPNLLPQRSDRVAQLLTRPGTMPITENPQSFGRSIGRLFAFLNETPYDPIPKRYTQPLIQMLEVSRKRDIPNF